MKFRVMMKNPDCVSDAIQEAAEGQVESIDGLGEDEKELLVESRKEDIEEFAKKWIEYSEYITVEFDTDAGTAVVIPVGE